MNTMKKDYWDELPSQLDENIKYLLDKNISAQWAAEKRYINSYYLIIAFSTVLFVLSSSLSNKVTILGMEISDINVLKWIIPVILSFLHYQGLSAFYWENWHRTEIEKVISKYLPSIYNHDLETFFSSPSFFNLERHLSGNDNDKIAVGFGVVVGIFLLFLPFIILGYFIYDNVDKWVLLNSMTLKIIVLSIVGLITIRNIFLVRKLIML